MPISVTSKGSFVRTESFLRKALNGDFYRSVNKYGAIGKAALAAATPVDSGLTAQSWTFKIEKTRTSFRITWENTNNQNGFPVAIMLQYGHGTGTGGYIAGRDYINPAIKPIFDQIEQAVMQEVSRL